MWWLNYPHKISYMRIIDAINRILLVIGESPVNKVDDPTVISTQAFNTLYTAQRQTLLLGWSFNIEEDYEFELDDRGWAFKRPRMLDIEFHDRNIVLKKDRVYNKKTKSFVFDEPVKARVLEDLSFEALPGVFQEYVTAKAARLLHEHTHQDPNQSILLQREERRLFKDCQEYEFKRGHFNMFDDIN